MHDQKNLGEEEHFTHLKKNNLYDIRQNPVKSIRI